MADGSPSIMWVTDAAGEVEFVNRAYQDFFGATCEEIEACRWQLRLHLDDAPDYVAAFECAVRDRLPFDAEARVRRADGEWRLLGSRAHPRFSPGGELPRARRPRADIAERKRAELALQESEERFRIMADSSPIEHMGHVDAQGGTGFINRAYRELFE